MGSLNSIKNGLKAETLEEPAASLFTLVQLIGMPLERKRAPFSVFERQDRDVVCCEVALFRVCVAFLYDLP